MIQSENPPIKPQNSIRKSDSFKFTLLCIWSIITNVFSSRPVSLLVLILGTCLGFQGSWFESILTSPRRYFQLTSKVFLAYPICWQIGYRNPLNIPPKSFKIISKVFEGVVWIFFEFASKIHWFWSYTYWLWSFDPKCVQACPRKSLNLFRSLLNVSSKFPKFASHE